MTPRVLIAHAEGEACQAKKLATSLNENGYEVVYEGTVLVGDSLVEQFSTLIDVGTPTVLCGTVRAIGTRWAKRVAYAAQQRSKLFIVQMERDADVESVSLGGTVARYWEDPAQAIRDLVASLNSYYSSLKVDPFAQEVVIGSAMAVEAWVRFRWPDTSENLTRPYPTWQEFSDGLVHIPLRAAKQVKDILAKDCVAMVVGRGASGKSIFGVCFSAQWAAEKGAPALWIDVREQDDVPRDELPSVSQEFSRIEHPQKLLVIDNAHVDNTLVRRWVDRHERGLPAKKGKLLLLARPRKSRSTGSAADLYTRLASRSVELEVDAHAFQGVADRLFRCVGRMAPWSLSDYSGWLDEFGRDLIAFCHAVLAVIHLPDGRSVPTRRGATRYIRERYVDIALSDPVGLEPFLRLSAMASLDLRIPDQVLGAPFHTLYKDLYNDGVAVEINLGTRRYWEFLHPSLAAMVLETVALDRNDVTSHLRQRQLLEAAKLSPSSLPTITARLRNGRYCPPSEFGVWCSFIEADPSLLARAMALNPSATAACARRQKWSINKQSLLTKDLYPLLHNTLRETSPNVVRSVLEFLGGNEAREILKGLLNDNSYLKILGKATPDHLIPFLNYIENEQARVILERLFATGYLDVICSALPHAIGPLLDFVERRRMLSQGIRVTSEAVIAAWFEANRGKPASARGFGVSDLAPLLGRVGVINAVLAGEILQWANS